MPLPFNFAKGGEIFSKFLRSSLVVSFAVLFRLFAFHLAGSFQGPSP